MILIHTDISEYSRHLLGMRAIQLCLLAKSKDNIMEMDAPSTTNLASELLPLFGFPEFTADFIDNFKDEIKALVDRATHFDFDWDGVEKSRLFQTRLQTRRRDARNADDVDDDWKKDAGEKAMRIWEWWRPVITNEAEFPCFTSLALKIIGTLQVSSCAVERVFSQLQVIRDVCGDKLYEDILEVRMFARCNGNLSGLWCTLSGDVVALTIPRICVI